MGLIDVFMCGFILIHINNKVKISTFLYKIDHKKGENYNEYKKYCIFVSMTTSF